MIDEIGKWVGVIGGGAGLLTTAFTFGNDLWAKRLSTRSRISCIATWSCGAAELRVRYAGRETHTNYAVTARLIRAPGCDFRQVDWRQRHFTPGEPEWESWAGASLGRRTVAMIDDSPLENGSAVFLIKGLYEQKLTRFRLRVIVRDDATNRVVAKRTMHIAVPDLH